MATGTELFLGVMGKDTIEFEAAKLNLEVAWVLRDLTPETRLDEINRLLVQTHVLALEEIGLKVMVPSLIRSATDYLIIERPDGAEAKIAAWDLQFYYDPDEMDEEPEHAVLGVSLITRYRPTWLDWKKRHGGSGDPIMLDGASTKMIQIARKRISKILPFIETAPVIIKDIHY